MLPTPTSTEREARRPSPKAVKDAFERSNGSSGVKPEQDVWTLVQDYLPLLKATVARMKIFFPPTLEVEDANSIGLRGLISAAQTYDSSRSASFATYARIRIRGAILDELRRCDRLSRRTRSKAKQLRATVEGLEQELQRAPTEEEVATALGLSVKDYQNLLEELRPVVLLSLDEIQEDDSDVPGSKGAFNDLTQADSWDLCERKELTKLVKLEFGRLPERHRKILYLFHFEELNLTEIAKVLGLSQARISQLYTEAILSLKATMRRAMNI